MNIDAGALLAGITTLLSALGLKELFLALVAWGRERAIKRGDREDSSEKVALSREEKLTERVTKLEGQMELQAQQLLESERIRARQEAQLADVCAERDTWRIQFHDLAVVVQRENEDVSRRILARYQAAQIKRSAPTTDKEEPIAIQPDIPQP